MRIRTIIAGDLGCILPRVPANHRAGRWNAECIAIATRELDRLAQGMQAELENVSAQVREGEGEGDAKSYKDEFAALQKRLGRLEKEERSLEEDMHIADLEPGQAQKQLLQLSGPRG